MCTITKRSTSLKEVRLLVPLLAALHEIWVLQHINFWTILCAHLASKGGDW